MKKLTFLIFPVLFAAAQSIPITVDHPVYHFLERQESLGNIESENWSTRPYTLSQVNGMLEEVASHKPQLSQREINTLKRYQKEFNRHIEEPGISVPWSKSSISGLLHPDRGELRPLLLMYRRDNTMGWITFSETMRLQNNGKANRSYYTDHLDISGVKGSIAFTTQYEFHRLSRSDDFSELPDSYKEGYILDRDYIEWINWGYPISSLTYTSDDFTLGIHRQPLYWGYSSTNSPILSDNTVPLPYIQWTTEMPHLRFKFIHARLSPNEAPLADSLNPRRNLSAHRVEFDINPNLEFAFNEMVIYAHRDFELGYLNPVNFLFAEEQVQGDLDNKLMALDFKWRALPGLTTYGTWFFDELDFWKLFSGWWGNKFVFQVGAKYYPTMNLPSLGIEYTASRPWTGSHQSPINSYTSAGRPLGLKDGPNTTRLNFSLDWQVSPKLYIQSQYGILNRGDDPGADIFNSYITHGEFDEVDESFISGDIQSFYHSRISLEYSFSQTISTQLLIDDGRTVTLETKLTW